MPSWIIQLYCVSWNSQDWSILSSSGSQWQRKQSPCGKDMWPNSGSSNHFGWEDTEESNTWKERSWCTPSYWERMSLRYVVLLLRRALKIRTSNLNWTQQQVGTKWGFQNRWRAALHPVHCSNPWGYTMARLAVQSQGIWLFWWQCKNSEDVRLWSIRYKVASISFLLGWFSTTGLRQKGEAGSVHCNISKAVSIIYFSVNFCN